MINPGDIIGFSGSCFVSDIVNIFTWGIPRVDISHVGILARHKNTLFLFESTTLDEIPCAILGKKIQGTQAHFLAQSIATYPGKVYHYALTEKLTDEQSYALTEFLISTLGISYDQLGAMRAGGVGFSFLEGLLHEENLHTIFCSEWCAAAHEKIGILENENASHFNPNHLVRWEQFKKILSKPVRLR